MRRPLALLPLLLLACSDSVPEPEPEAVADRFWSHRFAMTEDVSYGEDPAQKLDLYLQGAWVGEPNFFEPAPGPHPTLLYIHGGGWMQGDKTGQDPFFLPFVERGWQVVNITYRLGTGTAPAAVDDAMCALAWVAENAEQYGFDLDRIVVSGQSAGGHLSLTTGILGSREGHRCYPGNDFRVAAIVNWFGITEIESVETFLAATIPEMNYARAWVGDMARMSEISEAYSPIYLVDEDAPPILTIHGDSDSIVPHDQAERLHDRLEELGTTHELLTHTGGTHVGFTDEQFQTSFATIFDFLERVGA